MRFNLLHIAILPATWETHWQKSCKIIEFITCCYKYGQINREKALRLRTLLSIRNVIFNLFFYGSTYYKTVLISHHNNIYLCDAICMHRPFMNCNCGFSTYQKLTTLGLLKNIYSCRYSPFSKLFEVIFYFHL